MTNRTASSVRPYLSAASWVENLSRIYQRRLSNTRCLASTEIEPVEAASVNRLDQVDDLFRLVLFRIQVTFDVICVESDLLVEVVL